MHHLGTGDHKTPTGLRRLPLGLVAMLVTVVAIERYEVRRGYALSGCLASARETTVARGQARVGVEGVVALSTSTDLPGWAKIPDFRPATSDTPLESLADSPAIGMTGNKTARC